MPGHNTAIGVALVGATQSSLLTVVSQNDPERIPAKSRANGRLYVFLLSNLRPEPDVSAPKGALLQRMPATRHGEQALGKLGNGHAFKPLPRLTCVTAKPGTIRRSGGVTGPGLGSASDAIALQAILPTSTLGIREPVPMCP